MCKSQNYTFLSKNCTTPYNHALTNSCIINYTICVTGAGVYSRDSAARWFPVGVSRGHQGQGQTAHDNIFHHR